ncbi:MAG: Ig-like domain-containing protein [Candidatus Eisenbacteria bacterium]
MVSSDSSTAHPTITSPPFATSSTNELLLAFVSTDAVSGGMTVANVTGGGLAWVMVRRTNAQMGTAEIWRAFAPTTLAGVVVRASLSQTVAASITVVGFTGVDGSGTKGSGAIGATATGNANPGAPTATLTTTRANSWVWGVGTDWDHSTARTPGSGQTVVHEYRATVGDDYWVQRRDAPTAAAGTSVMINDTAPTNDRYDLTVVEVLPSIAATHTLSGAITPALSGVGTLITLSGAAAATSTVDPSGNYSFGGLLDGSYLVKPSKPGFTFAPESLSVVMTGADVPNVSFAATPVPTFTVSGTIAPPDAGAGTLVRLSGALSPTTTADLTGHYHFDGLPNGSYQVTPTRTGFVFDPASRTVDIIDADVPNLDFNTTAAPPPPVDLPDLSVIVPPGGISVAGTGSTRVLQYTHDTFNGGSGPLVIQPAYHPASGNYQGTQQVYTYNAGTWTLSQQIPVAGTFVFDAAHGHFHFPFAAFGLYTVAGGGGPGDPVVLSGKTGFCIADSYIYDPTLPNAGALGNLGSCSDPTSVRGLDIGAVDEYDQTDEGQSISLAGVPDGTYWLRAMVDPEGFLAESDESNNETDVKLTISGKTVQVLQTVTPALPPPPSIALTAPADQAVVSGSVDLTASTPVTTGVQFLLDGQPLGGIVTATPYVFPWQTTAAANGSHWLAAQTTDANGRIGTSAVVQVTVSNGAGVDTLPPVVTVLDPAQGEIVSASVAIGATVADDAAILGVQFYLDGVPIGASLTAPPYIEYWNTLGVADGPHSITARATDVVGLVGESPAVAIAVDNSLPPDPLVKDVTISQEGTGVIQTPAFSTTAPDELLLAFVGYDGPSNGPQTAFVSGAGLSWLLLKRSNVQHGTSEIWAARAVDPLAGATVIAQPGTGSARGSVTVVSFASASGPGVVMQASAPTGPPDIYVPGVSAGSWVFAVGNDYSNAIARVPVMGQEIVHQWLDTNTGDTYWVQSTSVPSAGSGLVDIHDLAPTTDQWNYAAVEVVPTRPVRIVGVGPARAPAPAHTELRPLTNPARGVIRLSARGRSDGVRDLWLIDIAGRRVAVFPGGMRLVQGAGSTTWNLAASGTRLAPGVYLVALVDRQGTIEATTRVVVLD